MKKFGYGLLIILAAYLQGCASTPVDPAEEQRRAEARQAAQQAKLEQQKEQQRIQAEIDKIVVSNGAPPAGAQQAGTVSGTDGKGCGMFGRRGIYEGAVAALKKQAYSRDTNYVHVLAVKEPFAREGCFENTYTINGMAYVVNSMGQTSSGSSDSLADRLQELKSLLAQGLISEPEYNELRSKALKGQ